jgi:hypothetical protein
MLGTMDYEEENELLLVVQDSYAPKVQVTFQRDGEKEVRHGTLSKFRDFGDGWCEVVVRTNDDRPCRLQYRVGGRRGLEGGDAPSAA